MSFGVLGWQCRTPRRQSILVRRPLYYRLLSKTSITLLTTLMTSPVPSSSQHSIRTRNISFSIPDQSDSPSTSNQHEANHSQSLPTSNQARTSLWKAVKGGITAAAALRNPSQENKDRNEERIDDEGMSVGDFHFNFQNPRERSRGPNGRRPTSDYYPAKYTDQWQNLAHLGINDEPQGSTSERRSRHSNQSGRNRSSDANASGITVESPSGFNRTSSILGSQVEDQEEERPSRSQTIKPPTSSSSKDPSKWKRFFSPTRSPIRSHSQINKDHDSILEETDSRRESINEEPQSFISHDPDLIPKGQDPLTYVDDDQDLLESDSDSDSDSGREDENGHVNGERRDESGNLLEGKKSSSMDRFRGMLPELTSLRKGILKCVLAYFIGSLVSLDFQSILTLPDLPSQTLKSSPSLLPSLSLLSLLTSLPTWGNFFQIKNQMLLSRIFTW